MQARSCIRPHPAIRNYGRKKTTTFGRGLRYYSVISTCRGFCALFGTLVKLLFFQQSAQAPLFLVFQLRGSQLLPLHVGRRIRPAGAERDDVIDHPAWAGLMRLGASRCRAGVVTDKVGALRMVACLSDAKRAGEKQRDSKVANSTHCRLTGGSTNGKRCMPFCSSTHMLYCFPATPLPYCRSLPFIASSMMR